MNKAKYVQTIDVEKFRSDLNGECLSKYQSYSEIARQIGYTSGSIGNVARGRDNPSRRMVTAICFLMGYTPDRYKIIAQAEPEEAVESIDSETSIGELIGTIISQNNAIIECLNKLIEEFK